MVERLVSRPFVNKTSNVKINSVVTKRGLKSRRTDWHDVGTSHHSYEANIVKIMGSNVPGCQSNEPKILATLSGWSCASCKIVMGPNAACEVVFSPNANWLNCHLAKCPHIKLSFGQISPL